MIAATIANFTESLSAWPDKLVNELKFVGDTLLLDDAIAILAANCLPDSKYPLGEVNSIYFDTSSRSYWYEKTDGDNLKQKVRMRWYGLGELAEDCQTTAFIEVKNRIGSARDKSRLAVPASYHWLSRVALDDLSLPLFLYTHTRDVIEPVPLNLLPVACITYERLRFVCPLTGSRIALDCKIRADRVNFSQFPAVTGSRLDQIVCEFKSVGKVLPEWAEALFSLGFRLRSFSKFGECINDVLHRGIPV